MDLLRQYYNNSMDRVMEIFSFKIKELLSLFKSDPLIRIAFILLSLMLLINITTLSFITMLFFKTKLGVIIVHLGVAISFMIAIITGFIQIHQ